MSNVCTIPSDNRASALYLLAHQGPLTYPRPVEVQHMRIRRYMDLLREFRGARHHYSEAHDIYVDFNFTGSGDFPGLMRLGEAIGQHRYRAVFVDFAGMSSYTGTSPRDTAYNRAMHTLRSLPVPLIDVSDDPEGVLLQRLKERFPHLGEHVLLQMDDGAHDFFCYFPGLAAEIARAIFYRYDEPCGMETVGNEIRRRIDLVREENPYRAGSEPWISDTLMRFYWEREKARQKEEAEQRRVAGKMQFRVDPRSVPKPMEEGLWRQAGSRDLEGIAAAEKRLLDFGFQKVTDGTAVAFIYPFRDLTLYADPREAGRISVTAYRLDPGKGRHPKPRWVPVGHPQTILDTWWKADPAEQFLAFVEKQFPEDSNSEAAHRFRRHRRKGDAEQAED